MFISTACVVTYSAAPGMCPVKIGRMNMQGDRSGAGRVPFECRPLSVRASFDEQVHTMATGDRPGSSRRPYGAPRAAVLRIELCVLSHCALRINRKKIMRAPSGHRPEPARDTLGASRSLYGLSTA